MAQLWTKVRSLEICDINKAAPVYRANYSNWHPANTHKPETERCLALVDEDGLAWISLPCSGRQAASLKLQPLCETSPV